MGLKKGGHISGPVLPSSGLNSGPVLPLSGLNSGPVLPLSGLNSRTLLYKTSHISLSLKVFDGTFGCECIGADLMVLLDVNV